MTLKRALFLVRQAGSFVQTEPLFPIQRYPEGFVAPDGRVLDFQATLHFLEQEGYLVCRHGIRYLMSSHPFQDGQYHTLMDPSLTFPGFRSIVMVFEYQGDFWIRSFQDNITFTCQAPTLKAACAMEGYWYLDDHSDEPLTIWQALSQPS